MDNSTLNLFGLMQAKPADETNNNVRNQQVTDSSAAGVFKQLLAMQTQLKDAGAHKAGVKGLLVDGKDLPIDAIKLLLEFKEGSIGQLSPATLKQISQFETLDLPQLSTAALKQLVQFQEGKLSSFSTEVSNELMKSKLQGERLSPEILETLVKFSQGKSVEFSEEALSQLMGTELPKMASTKINQFRPEVLQQLIKLQDDGVLQFSSEQIATETSAKSSSDLLDQLSKFKDDGITQLSSKQSFKVKGAVSSFDVLEQLVALTEVDEQQFSALSSLSMDVVKQLKSLKPSDLAVLAEQIVQQSGSAQAKKFEGFTGLQSVEHLTVLAEQAAKADVAQPATDVIKGPWSDKQLSELSQQLGASKPVVEKVLAATIGAKSSPASASQTPLTDDDVLQVAKEASVIQLDQARKERGLGSPNTFARSDLSAMLQQAEGKLRAKIRTNINEVKASTDKATTADSFLMNRSAFKANLTESVITKVTQFDSMMGHPRSQITPEALPSMTSSFLAQRGLGMPVLDSDIKVPLNGSPLNLVATDTAQHSLEQVQRAASGQFRENFMGPQNEERLQKAVGERIMRMVESGNWDAEIELNPVRLGAIRIRLNMENNELQVVMSSQNAGVRDLLEATMPRLREGLLESGIALSHSSVGQELSQQQDGSLMAKEQSSDQQMASKDSSVDESEEKSINNKSSSHDGELDTFA